MELINDNKEYYLKNTRKLSIIEEEKIYSYFEYIRTLLKDKDRINFFQLWQQKNFISDLDRAIHIDINKEYYLEFNKKDKKDKKCAFFLPQINKIIYIDYKKGTRKIPGWVKYIEYEF